MIVVSDTSPLRYLVLIGKIEILPRMFGQVLCPATVCSEGSHPRAPAALRNLLATPPAWLVIEKDVPLTGGIDSFLDPGEIAAISLAEERGADVLLMDERKGRQVAEKRGLRVAGTINVLADAAVRGWLDYHATISQLRTETNFRISEVIVEKAYQQSLGTQDS